MRALVTGCAGFIGSHLTERLLADGVSVVGVDAFSPTYDTTRRRERTNRLRDHRLFEFIEGDIAAIDLRPHLDGCDVVYHLAARPGVRASWENFAQVSATNVLGTQRILQALTSYDDISLVFSSSSSVYGAAESFPTTEDTNPRPISPYGVSKIAGETLVSAYAIQFGISAVSLRYFTVYGPRQRSDMAFTKWIRAAINEEPLPLFGDGSAVRDFTYVADVVEANLLAAGLRPQGHQAFNIAGGHPVSVREVLNEIADLLGTPIRVDTRSVAKGDPLKTTGDITKFRGATGWDPRWKLRDGLREQIAWVHSPD